MDEWITRISKLESIVTQLTNERDAAILERDTAQDALYGALERIEKMEYEVRLLRGV